MIFMISIIIPIFNQEDYIHICLNSLIKQSYENFEAICCEELQSGDQFHVQSTLNELIQSIAKKDAKHIAIALLNEFMTVCSGIFSSFSIKYHVEKTPALVKYATYENECITQRYVIANQM